MFRSYRNRYLRTFHEAENYTSNLRDVAKNFDDPASEKPRSKLVFVDKLSQCYTSKGNPSYLDIIKATLIKREILIELIINPPHQILYVVKLIPPSMAAEV